MNVSWKNIKQRSHFIAERLSKHLDIEIFYEKSYKKSFVDNPNTLNLKLNELWRLPLKNYTFIRYFNLPILKAQLRNRIEPSSYMWISHPNTWEYLKELKHPKNIVIYDCMDDALEFPYVKRSNREKNRLSKVERELCENSKLIFTSSAHLKNKLIRRYNINGDRIKVINNALDIQTDHTLSSKPILPDNLKACLTSEFTKIVYIGAISEWIDFELILQSLKRNNKIKYFLIGPKDVSVPLHERIETFGPVRHEYLASIMELSDILVMPFVTNDLILSVDPIKVYEYISSYKPTIVKKYGETIKFSDYIYLYENSDEYLMHINKIADNNFRNKIDCGKCLDYLAKNTWENRVKDILCELKKL